MFRRLSVLLYVVGLACGVAIDKRGLRKSLDAQDKQGGAESLLKELKESKVEVAHTLGQATGVKFVVDAFQFSDLDRIKTKIQEISALKLRQQRLQSKLDRLVGKQQDNHLQVEGFDETSLSSSLDSLATPVIVPVGANVTNLTFAPSPADQTPVEYAVGPSSTEVVLDARTFNALLNQARNPMAQNVQSMYGSMGLINGAPIGAQPYPNPYGPINGAPIGAQPYPNSYGQMQFTEKQKAVSVYPNYPYSSPYQSPYQSSPYQAAAYQTSQYPYSTPPLAPTPFAPTPVGGGNVTSPPPTPVSLYNQFGAGNMQYGLGGPNWVSGMYTMGVFDQLQASSRTQLEMVSQERDALRAGITKLQTVEKRLKKTLDTLKRKYPNLNPRPETRVTRPTVYG